jgi:hypothetical protein
MAQYQTRSVLAGAYLRRDTVYLTHLAEVDADGVEIRSLCRVKLDSFADQYAHSVDVRPTCPTCAKKWDRLEAAGLLRISR